MSTEREWGSEWQHTELKAYIRCTGCGWEIEVYDRPFTVAEIGYARDHMELVTEECLEAGWVLDPTANEGPWTCHKCG